MKIIVWVENGPEPLKPVEFTTQISGYEPFIAWSGTDLLIQKKKPEGGAPITLARFAKYVYYEKSL